MRKLTGTSGLALLVDPPRPEPGGVLLAGAFELAGATAMLLVFRAADMKSAGVAKTPAEAKKGYCNGNGIEQCGLPQAI
jgi:hypothetical protein